ncbi:MAG: hypothetical protein IKU83_02660 [Lachnospiraceae bacterium]|nr:hypothetical protein [Lachnospiraceae bacterium]
MCWLKKNWLWIVLLILFFFMRWEKQHFTVEKWERDPEARNEIVYDLMDRYELVGMTEKEVEDFLGENGLSRIAGDDQRYLSYEIGMEPGWISVDVAWLYLVLEKDVVTECYIVTG